MASEVEILSAAVIEYRKLEAAAKQSFDGMAQTLTPPFKVASRRCEDERSNIIKCYSANPNDVFLCRSDIENFSRCASEQHRAHLELVDKFQTMRELHRQQQAPQVME